MVQGYGYNGERRDQSGLIYLRARYYNPKIGRFIQIDSYRGEKEQPDTQNRYIYTLNNPYKYTDPSGHISTLIGGLGALGDLLAALAAAASAIGAAFSVATATAVVGYIGIGVAIGMGINWLVKNISARLQATPGPLPTYQGSDGTTYYQNPYGGMGGYYPQVDCKTITAEANAGAIPNSKPNFKPRFNEDEMLGRLRDNYGTLENTLYQALVKSIESLFSKDRVENNKTENHHIVAKNAGGAESARKILKNADIGINSTENLVPLKYWFHRVLHNKLYYLGVNNVIDDNLSPLGAHQPAYRQQVINNLYKVRGALLFVNNLV